MFWRQCKSIVPIVLTMGMRTDRQQRRDNNSHEPTADHTTTLLDAFQTRPSNNIYCTTAAYCCPCEEVVSMHMQLQCIDIHGRLYNRCCYTNVHV